MFARMAGAGEDQRLRGEELDLPFWGWARV